MTKEILYKKYITEKKSMTEIAKELNCAYSSVNRWLKQYNIPIRTNGSGKIKDITGKKYGKLTAIKIDLSKKNNKGWSIPQWICQCDCGNTHVAYYSHLRDNTTTRCLNCVNKEKENKEEFSNLLWRQIKKSAKKRNIEIKINKNEIYQIFLKQEKKCALSGMSIIMINNVKNATQTTASLDRIDNSRHYTLDNIQWIHKDINKMKLNFNQDYFFYLCQCIYYNKIKNIELINKNIPSKPFKLYFLNIIKKKAKERNISFNITIQNCIDQFDKQKGKCNLSNLPIFFTSTYQHQHNKKSTASLDRIDNLKGYEPSNIQWVHKNINQMKWNFKEKYLINICKNIILNLDQSKLRYITTHKFDKFYS